jgi:hypothetical protein
VEHAYFTHVFFISMPGFGCSLVVNTKLLITNPIVPKYRNPVPPWRNSSQVSSHSAIIMKLWILQTVRLLGRVMSPSQGRYLHRKMKAKRKRIYPVGFEPTSPVVWVGEDISCFRPHGRCNRHISNSMVSSYKNCQFIRCFVWVSNLLLTAREEHWFGVLNYSSLFCTGMPTESRNSSTRRGVRY